MKKYIVVNKENEEYAKRLVKRLKERYGDSGFETVFEEDIDDEKDCVRLSKEKTTDKKAVYMYQKVSDIRKEILEKFSEKVIADNTIKSRISIIFSPVLNPYQCFLARREAVNREKDLRCLLIEVDYFSNSGEVGISLSDLCFMVHKGSDNLIDKDLIEEAVIDEEGIKVMRGFISPIHITSLGREFNELIKIIAARCGFDEILISLNALPPNFEEIFKMADEIILYNVDDPVIAEKREVCREGFRKYLTDIGVDAVNLRLKEKRITCRIMEN